MHKSELNENSFRGPPAGPPGQQNLLKYKPKFVRGFAGTNFGLLLTSFDVPTARPEGSEAIVP